MSWLNGFFGGKSDGSPSLAPLTDREYEQLFLQVLQGVAVSWDEQRLLKFLGDRCGDRQMMVWLRGYGDRLLSEPANPDLAGKLVRLGEIGCGELGVVAQGIGLEMGNIPVEQVVSVVELKEVDEGQNSEAERFYQKGLVELQAGKYQEALDYFDRAIAFKLNNFDVWINRGMALQNLNRIDEAIESNERAISLSRAIEIVNTEMDRGYSLYELKRYEEAIICFDRVISINPDNATNATAWSLKGLCQAELGRDEEAIKCYDRSISIYPHYANVWYNKGNYLGRSGEYKEAIKCYVEAISINPKFDKAWFEKGVSLATLEEYEEAIKCYIEAISINPKLDEAWLKRGEAWFKKGVSLAVLEEYEEAIKCYVESIRINPDDAVTWFNKGVSVASLGKHKEAIKCYVEAIRINPKFDKAWYNKGDSLTNLGRYEEAIKCHDEAISINPKYDKARNGKGMSLDKSGKYDEAIKCYDEALSMNPCDAISWHDRGATLTKLRRHEEAITSFDRALTITKGNLWQAWISRGIAALKSDDRKKDALRELFDNPLPKDTQSPALDLRGYLGRIASINEGFKYINQDIDPEGWGQLHRAIGNAHYLHGRSQTSPFPFWRKSFRSYNNALKAFAAAQLETLYLETLKELIRVLLSLRRNKIVEGILRKGTSFRESWLEKKNISEERKKRLEKKFKPYFNELTVSLYIQQGKLKEALELAEEDKNIFMREGLLADTPESSPKYSEMCDFLKQKPETAIIYWHLSDNALTTFILAPNASSEITLTLPTDNTDDSETFNQINRLKDWMTAWQDCYADYRAGENKSESKEPKPEEHFWRDQMEAHLTELKSILRIDDIEKKLADFSHCKRLILIPHRDLHLYPLDSLFELESTGEHPKYKAIAYLPSIKVGIEQPHKPKPDYNRLLMIENPHSTIELKDGTKQDLAKLTAAEVESELICRMYVDIVPTCLEEDKHKPTLEEVTTQLTVQTPQPHTIFHFTGHGYYDFFNPLDSALALSGSDRLTLKEIGNLKDKDKDNNRDLSSYQLACLSACETAIAGNQSITDEYVGIVSAFMYSGVANVVSTLWTVESISSAILMIEFHRRYLQGTSADVALAATKHWLRKVTRQDLIDWYDQEINNLPPNDSLIVLLKRHRNKLSTELKYNNPYYWTAFTITGL
ncbi:MULTISPECIES: CHAT domain-containing protein [Pseudanabaena]|uniref:CHAT domain-containing protein n=1 Tax=Pseudanabaena TaxID=1152 RepID=UPI002478B02C|nr:MULTISPECIES: CHAT domain-containing protein [Pseudanabaena]MEA5489864.1 tetratricopeptide repeat protein [Pseudanabaena sp. CCNP1317]WGS74154.1 tetratricopeptide repeat protein [Pseudanabaena galeata CCNP1313]